MYRFFKLSLLSATVAFAIALFAHRNTIACPFCSATAQTLRQDMAAMDVVTFGELLTEGQPEEIAGMADFKITQSLRGAKIVAEGTKISAPYYGPRKSTTKFLLMGVQQNEVLWSSPLTISKEAEKYLSDVVALPDDGSQRLRFFMKYLEHAESLLARDAYEEFAQTPYDEVKKIRDAIDHTQLVDWIKSNQVAPDRKRLYYTLLGVCGQKEDAALLEALLRSKDDSTRAGLDALIACYLTVVGESGLPLIEDLFMKNSKASYPDTFASVMALRFHGTEGGVIDRSKIVKSMQCMLERPDFADLVIPDLARWEDWSQIDRMVSLFKDADDSTSWVRVPVVNYLRACPLPAAKEKLVELEKIDPKAVKRAATFFPIPQPAAPQGPGKANAGKNETSLLTPAIMRIPLGARGPWASRFGMDMIPNSNDSPQSVNRFGLCAVALLASTTLTMLMWMILAGGPTNQITLARQCWSSLHRWTHHTPNA